MKQLPKIGEFYHFFDDGKTSSSRHYICKCERIITPKEAKGIMVSVPEWDFESSCEYIERMTLYDQWKNQVNECHWLYAEDTDYFVECSCPKYDENNLWFVREKNGGWFSIDIQSSWQSGRLDVDSTIYEGIIEECKKYDWNIGAYEEQTYEDYDID